MKTRLWEAGRRNTPLISMAVMKMRMMMMMMMVMVMRMISILKREVAVQASTCKLAKGRREPWEE